MTPISLALPMLFFTPLIILLPNWLLWGCLFNLASAQHGLYLAYFLGSSPLSNFYCFLDNIRILGVSFGFASFISSFLKKVLDEDVQHAYMFSRLGDVYVAFSIFS